MFKRSQVPFWARPISKRRVASHIACVALARLCRLVTARARAVSATVVLGMSRAASARTTLQAADSIPPRLLVHFDVGEEIILKDLKEQAEFLHN